MGYCLEKELGFDQCICMGSGRRESSMVCVGPPSSGRLERPYPKYRVLNYFSGAKGVE